jgi:hypothetical protein
MEVIKRWWQANKYHNQYLDTLDSGSGLQILNMIAVKLMDVFLVIIVQMEQDIRHSKRYWYIL